MVIGKVPVPVIRAFTAVYIIKPDCHGRYINFLITALTPQVNIDLKSSYPVPLQFMAPLLWRREGVGDHQFVLVGGCS